MSLVADSITADDLDDWLEDKKPAERVAPSISPTDDAGQVDDAREYVSKMDIAVSGQGGHSRTLAVARTLVHDFGLSEGTAAALLHEYSQRCQPSWSDAELAHKIRQAVKLSQTGDCENPYRSKGRKAELGYTIKKPSRTAPEAPKTSVPWKIPESAQTPPVAPPYSILTLDDVLTFDVDNDPNCLIGNRYLCKGGSLGIVGQTGIGKSSLTMQFATSMGLGLPLFGITPVRPLSSVIIQAENDIGDVNEELNGVLSGLGAYEHKNTLSSKLRIIHECVKMGKEFAGLAREVANDLKPDLIIIDPWFAFMGCDSSDQEKISQFLRGWLNPIAQETGVAWVIIHHTPKPRAEKPGGQQFQSSDFSYFGAGSAEFSNWCRAMLVLREIGEDRYELRAAKRGKRSGLCFASGQPAPAVQLRHATDRIFWEYANETVEEKIEKTTKKREQQDKETTVIEFMGTRGWKRADLEREIKTRLEVSESTASRMVKNMQKFFDRNAIGQYSVKPELRLSISEGPAMEQGELPI